MNATKRKFNALIQGMGRSSASTKSNDSASLPNESPRPSTTSLQPTDTNSSTATTATMTTTTTNVNNTKTSMSIDEDILLKRRRLQALTEKNAATIKSSPSIRATGPGTTITNVVLKKWTPNSSKVIEVKVASKFAPSDRGELLKRLASFQEITDWTPKPDAVNEVEWAKRGWVCQGKDRVRCTLCNKELVVKLNKREVDGKEVPVLVASDVEEALVDKYSDLIVTAHTEECLWKRQGCDDSLLRLSLTNAKISMEALRHRYDELCGRKPFLPYEFNLRLPEGLDIDNVLSQLPDDFFTNPPPAKDSPDPKQPNRVALALALTGWQGLTNPRIGAVPNSASCHTCLRRLGLWMFKSKEVNGDGEILVPAPMDHLDPVKEHRFFCPWKNPRTQRLGSAKPGSESDMAAWKCLAQVLKNDAYLRGALDDRPKNRWHSRGASVPSTPVRRGVVPPLTPGGYDSPSAASEPGGDDDDKARDAKDKERWARLRRVKSLFESKNAKKIRRQLSRPGTAQSTVSGAATGDKE
ncbi:Putative Zinc finger, C3HC, nuclear-interacting partner of ALK/Rsm1-like protein [Colletotrichum destructivum]|uniref:Zinc finger, C3HC, nuclear-interacting partner of ALK/Rsm1-like protein n=1 Tax=Colletotrichum destructivum TaxID=34406 RepID=A0AAX4ILU3_9PEZI|nr:Putative Zinc finger, C3HC, nuclear-interacting partner of ALK/Rsm1-like protein [Colletotrichum destructivum]